MIINKDGKIMKYVEHRIRARRLKWRLDSSVLCGPRILTRLERKFYKIDIRPAIIHGANVGLSGNNTCKK